MEVINNTSQEEVVNYRFKLLKQLTGTWKGKGVAEFPTIDKTEYIEELTFEIDEYKQLIHYVQKVLHKTNDERNESLLHWESGFIVFKDDGIFLINSQSNGRVEVMKGEIMKNDSETILKFQSIQHGNDKKMKSSTRIYKINGENMDYSLDMSITKVNNSRNHLKCKLSRNQ